MEENIEKKELKNRNKLIASFVVVALVCFALGFFIQPSITGNIVGTPILTPEEAGIKVVDFIDTYLLKEKGTSILNVSEESGIYAVQTKITYKNETFEYPVYLTKNGNFLLLANGQWVNIPDFESSQQRDQNQRQATTDIPKTDKPKVELFIWSYCPYGVTALGSFAEVNSLLGDLADFKVYLYYAGHGDFEVQQNKIQACIQKLDSKSYWDYAKTFANKIYKKCYGDAACDLEESIILMKSLGIDFNKVLDCVNSEGDSLLDADYRAAGQIGVTGSPTLVINGVKVNAARNAEAYKQAVCSAFNTAPEECSQTLDSTGTASGTC